MPARPGLGRVSTTVARLVASCCAVLALPAGTALVANIVGSPQDLSHSTADPAGVWKAEVRMKADDDRAGGGATPLRPSWVPTFVLQNSTFAYLCNFTGFVDPVLAGRFALVAFDQSNQRGVGYQGEISGGGGWKHTDADQSTCDASMLQQASLVKRANPNTRVFIYRNAEAARQTFSTLNRPGIFYSTHAMRTHASAAVGMNRHAWTGMHEPACILHAYCMHAACINRHAWTGMRACMNRHAAAAAAAAACMRACVVARVIDTVYQLIYSSAQTQAWRIEFPYRHIDEY
jgi:hypothetical protein